MRVVYITKQQKIEPQHFQQGLSKTGKIKLKLKGSAKSI